RSIPERENVLRASAGVAMIGSPFRLKEVFSTTGTPVAEQARLKRSDGVGDPGPASPKSLHEAMHRNSSFVPDAARPSRNVRNHISNETRSQSCQSSSRPLAWREIRRSM